jgi:hypothetical protein
MKAIDLRVREETLALARALCEQRNLERAALLREGLEVGLLLLAASGPPAAVSETETYGTLAGLRLAQLLRPRLAPVVDFLSRYGATPLALPPSPRPPITPAPAQHVRSAPDGFAVDDAVRGTLDAFGVGALGDEA